MKNARHEQILLLIEQYEIETQEELAERLNEAGFTVTQATVSRDIRQLQLRKVTSSSGKLRYTVGSVGNADLSQKYKRVLEDAFVSAEYVCTVHVSSSVTRCAVVTSASFTIVLSTNK